MIIVPSPKSHTHSIIVPDPATDASWNCVQNGRQPAASVTPMLADGLANTVMKSLKNWFNPPAVVTVISYEPGVLKIATYGFELD